MYWGTVIAIALMPLATLFFRWCGRKIRDGARKLPDGRIKNALLFTIYSNDDKFDTDLNGVRLIRTRSPKRQS